MASVSHFYLLRHGACEGGQIFRGRTDSALTHEGARQMAEVLAGFKAGALDAVYSSPLKRCLQPARHFCQKRALPLQECAALAEIDFGDWEGEAVASVEQRAPKAITQFWRDPLNNPPPGAETLQQFQQRVTGQWQDIYERGRGQCNLIVTHGGVIRLILAQLLDMPLRPLSYIHVPHASLSHIAIYHSEGQPDWPQLIFHNGQLPND